MIRQIRINIKAQKEFWWANFIFSYVFEGHMSSASIINTLSLLSSSSCFRWLAIVRSEVGEICRWGELATVFGESSNAVRCELNHLIKSKVLESKRKGRTIDYRSNFNYPLLEEVSSVARKMFRLDQAIKVVVPELGILYACTSFIMQELPLLFGGKAI
jgi:hypothetical protein